MLKGRCGNLRNNGTRESITWYLIDFWLRQYFVFAFRVFRTRTCLQCETYLNLFRKSRIYVFRAIVIYSLAVPHTRQPAQSFLTGY